VFVSLRLRWFFISKSEDAAVRDDLPSANHRTRRRSGPGLAENVQSFERPSTPIVSPAIQRALSKEGEPHGQRRPAKRGASPRLGHPQLRQRRRGAILSLDPSGVPVRHPSPATALGAEKAAAGDTTYSARE